MYRSPDGHAWHLPHTTEQGGGLLKPRGGVGHISIHSGQRTLFVGCMVSVGQLERVLLQPCVPWGRVSAEGREGRDTA